MQDPVKKDILAILEAGLAALAERDTSRLREISDHTVHNASIFQDKDSVTIAVVMYALSKLVDRMARVEPDVTTALEQAKAALESGDFAGYEQCIKSVVETIKGIDSKLNLYIQRVINEAEIKKGSRIYEHGISLAQTAELLGISQWELMRYLGQTMIADGFTEEVDVRTRLEHARRLFK